ncbi:MAG: hypothetical protein ACI964_001606 [Spirosomataceae bacterium]|jgi:hypothetical protein
MHPKKLLLLTLFLFVNSLNAVSQTKADTLKVLFVGNSYTYYNNMPQLVSVLSDSTPTKLITRKSTVGGVTLKNHWLGERGLKTKEIIAAGGYDIVVIQGYSMGTIDHPEDFKKYSQELCDFIKASGAKPYFYMTWARERVPQYQETITAMYNQVARENGAGIIPVGKAWELARQLRPNLELFVPDGSHPSAIGSFLIASVFTKAFTGELPKTVPSRFTIMDADGESIWLMAPDALDMVFCMKVAESVVGK